MSFLSGGYSLHQFSDALGLVIFFKLLELLLLSSLFFSTWLVLKPNIDLTYIEIWTDNFCYIPETFLGCIAGGPIKFFWYHIKMASILHVYTLISYKNN